MKNSPGDSVEVSTSENVNEEVSGDAHTLFSESFYTKSYQNKKTFDFDYKDTPSNLNETNINNEPNSESEPKNGPKIEPNEHYNQPFNQPNSETNNENISPHNKTKDTDAGSIFSDSFYGRSYFYSNLYANKFNNS
jgi:hypothetical protein